MAKATKQDYQQRLGEQLDKVIARHRRRKQHPELEGKILKLASWQSRRLLDTYADLYATERYRQAVTFFTEDMYGEKDFSKRDMDAKKVYPIMSRVLPGSMIGTLATVMELNALTMELDDGMVEALTELGAMDDINEESYAEAFRRNATLDQRRYQMSLVLQVGKELARYVKYPYISGALKVASKPAHMLGLGELQDVLERGFASYKGMNGADEFLFQIEDREGKIMDKIFAGEPKPFEIDKVPLK